MSDIQLTPIEGMAGMIASAIKQMQDYLRGKKDAGNEAAAIAGLSTAVLTPMIAAGNVAATNPILDLVTTWLSKLMTDGVERASNWLLDNLVRQSFLPQAAADQIRTMLHSMGAFSPLILFFLTVFMCVGYLKNFVDTSFGLAAQNLAATFRPNLPSSGDVLRAAFIDPSTINTVKDIMRRAGLRDDHISLLFKASYRLYDEGTVRELYLRGELTPQQMYNRMRELGYTDTRTAEIVKTWALIPGVQDLIYMTVKEAFNEPAVTRFGLDSEPPTDAFGWMEKQGLSAAWGQKYWRAHWQHPSPMQGMEMLHRGVISEDDLDELLHVLDYPPYWRAKLREISYNPYTRVDIRRMYQAGILSEAQVTRAYQDMGYDLERAQNLTAWTKLEYGEEDKSITADQILSGYELRQLTESETIGLLKELGYDDTKARFLLTMRQLREGQDLLKEKIAVIQASYMARNITDFDARAALQVLDIGSEYIDALVMRWRLALDAKRARPSKTDLDKFLKAGTIGPEEYREEMRGLGYSETYINWYLGWKQATERTAAAIEQLKHKIETYKTTTRPQYIDGKVSDTEVRVSLRRLQVSEDEIESILAKWSTEKMVQAKPLSRSELDRLLKAEVINEADYIAAMQKIGYSEEHARKLAVLARKIPTKAEIDELYLTHVIAEPDYRLRLEALGYSKDDIDLYVKLAATRTRAPTPIPERLPTKTDLETMFVDGLIDETEYRSRLAALNYSSATIDLYVQAAQSIISARQQGV